MKITRLDLRSLHNEEWFQFFTEFKTLAESPALPGIEEQFNAFTTKYAEAGEVLEKITKSGFTDQMVNADTERDNLFRGFVAAVNAASNHFNLAIHQAGAVLQIPLHTYGNLAVLAYDKETAAISNFLQEMNTATNHAAIQTLNLEEWITELDKANKAFDSLVQGRYSEASGKTELQMLNVRKEMQGIYSTMVARIEASALLAKDEQYSTFIHNWNLRTEHFKNLIAQRKGRKAASKAKVAEATKTA